MSMLQCKEGAVKKIVKKHLFFMLKRSGLATPLHHHIKCILLIFDHETPTPPTCPNHTFRIMFGCARVKHNQQSWEKVSTNFEKSKRFVEIRRPIFMVCESHNPKVIKHLYPSNPAHWQQSKVQHQHRLPSKAGTRGSLFKFQLKPGRKNMLRDGH